MDAEVANSDKDPLEALAELELEQEESTEEEIPTEEENTDEIEEQTEETLQEEETENVEEKKEVFKRIKAAGQEFEFTQEEVNEQFDVTFQKALDYTKKTKAIAPWRKSISALEENNLTHEDINLLIDAKKGNKDAIAALMQQSEIDPLDVDIEDDFNFTPNEYGKTEQELVLIDIIDTIASDKEYPITVDVIDNQWDSSSRDIIANNPETIKGLHNDIKSGVFDKVSPLAMKMKVLDGNSRPDIEYYLEAGKQYLTNEQVNQANSSVSSAEKKYADESTSAKEKQAASTTRRRAGTGVVDYLEDEEKFDEWYKNLEPK